MTYDWNAHIAEFKRRLPAILNGNDWEPISNDFGKPDPKAIIGATARAFDVSETAILGRSRYKNDVTARHAAAYIMHNYLGLSSNKIGQALGGRDHTTVLYALPRAKRLKKTNMAYKKKLDQIVRTVALGPGVS